jgi:hypothetical protein
MRLATPLLLASAAAALVACGKNNQAADTTGMGATTGAMGAPATMPPPAGTSTGAAGGMAGMSTGAAAGSTSAGGMKATSDSARTKTRHSPTPARP